MAIRLHDGLVAHATDGSFEGGNEVYTELRLYFLNRPDTKQLLPDFVRRYRDLSQFWAFINTNSPGTQNDAFIYGTNFVVYLNT
jgi:hypothetical protein